MKISFKWIWYDLWIGFYWDRYSKVLYFAPLPTMIFKFDTEYLTKCPCGHLYKNYSLSTTVWQDGDSYDTDYHYSCKICYCSEHIFKERDFATKNPMRGDNL